MTPVIGEDIENEIAIAQCCRRILAVVAHRLHAFLELRPHGNLWRVRSTLAGEATHVHDYSTARGAHDSGVRAAEEAIAALTSVAGMNAIKRGASGSS